MKVMEKNKMNEHLKLVEYSKKQEEIEKHKHLMESIILNNQKARVEVQKQKEVKLIKGRIKNEEIGKKKVDSILTKISYIEQKRDEHQSKHEKDLMYKQEMALLKMSDRFRVIKRMQNIEEYQKEEKMEEVQNKMKRAEEFKYQKQIMGEKKKEIAESINKQKKRSNGEI